MKICSTYLLAVFNDGKDTIRWILFWLKEICADQTMNVLISKFQRVVRVVKSTDKLKKETDQILIKFFCNSPIFYGYFLCFEKFLVFISSSYFNWNSLPTNLYVKKFKLKKCIVLLGWNNSATTNRPVPYIIESNMINARRCNCYKCWCQNECMNYANGDDCFKATLKCNFFTVQKCSPRQKNKILRFQAKISHTRAVYMTHT